MQTKNILLCSFLLSSILFGSISASAQHVFDNFDSGTIGHSLVGYVTPVGGLAYESSGINSFYYDSIAGNRGVRANLGVNDATTSIVIPGMPTDDKVRLEAVVNFNANIFTGIAGAWIGYTGADSVGLLYGADDEAIVLRFFSTGVNAGRLQLRTDGQVAASPGVSALEVHEDRDYLMTLEYNFNSLLATATVTDMVSEISTSASYVLTSKVALSKVQFEFTGLINNDQVGELPYFKSISITP